MSRSDRRGHPTAPATGAGAAGRATSACAICGQQPGSEPVVRTTQGGLVHVVCAERAALRAWSRRRWAALGHALLASLTLIALALWIGGSPALLAVALAWAGLYTLLHRRALHHLRRDLRRHLRRR
jgi:predicted lysophospholipase L1 biosynthesis ABC-type transport system permease subunit